MHGGITSNTNLYIAGGGYGSAGGFTDGALYPSAVGSDPNLTVNSLRDTNCLIAHAFGFAFSVTGTSTYKTQGDDIFEAALGGADGYQSTVNLAGKQFNQGFRTSTRYVALRLSAGSPAQSVSPSVKLIAICT